MFIYNVLLCVKEIVIIIDIFYNKPKMYLDWILLRSNTQYYSHRYVAVCEFKFVSFVLLDKGRLAVGTSLSML